jgi:hypothetical protein
MKFSINYRGSNDRYSKSSEHAEVETNEAAFPNELEPDFPSFVIGGGSLDYFALPREQAAVKREQDRQAEQRFQSHWADRVLNSGNVTGLFGAIVTTARATLAAPSTRDRSSASRSSSEEAWSICPGGYHLLYLQRMIARGVSRP